MKSKIHAHVLFLFLVSLTTVLLPVSELSGQEVVLRSGERLDLSVPQRQDLRLKLDIDENGNIHIPIIGAVDVEGLTVVEAEAVLLRRLREIYPSIRSLTLTLIGEEDRRYIYVHGEVVNPDKYEFEGNPNVWEAIREAGGATGEAYLGAVRVIHSGEDERKTTIVNLQDALDTGDLSSLPELKPGDTVIVPAASARYQGSGAINVIGAVVNPAPYMLSEGRTLVDAILAAGGPDDNANLEKVFIIRRHPDGTVSTTQINFKLYLENGDLRNNPEVYPGDTINIDKRGGFIRLLTDPYFLLGIITATSTAVLAIVLR